MATLAGCSPRSVRMRIHLGGENEVALGQTIDLVCPNLNPDLAPRQVEIGMMTLLLGDRSDAVYEGQRLREVGKSVGLGQVMILPDFPTIQLAE